MRLGDDPELRRLAGEDDGTVCPKCGKKKKPEFEFCYECGQKQKGARTGRGQGGEGKQQRGKRSAVTLPDSVVFATFFDDEGKLRQELFFEAPQRVADLFQKGGYKPTALRRLYQGFQSFALPLRDGRMDFATAQEKFGVFYVEGVVRQFNREFLPEVVKQFVDRHRELALSGKDEMLGLFRYVTNILCYFGDKG